MLLPRVGPALGARLRSYLDCAASGRAPLLRNADDVPFSACRSRLPARMPPQTAAMNAPGRADSTLAAWRPRELAEHLTTAYPPRSRFGQVAVGGTAEVMVFSMTEGFRRRRDDRAALQGAGLSLRGRGLPPVEGAERQMILRQMRLDFQDFAMLGDAVGSLEDGILTRRIDLRPAPES